MKNLSQNITLVFLLIKVSYKLKSKFISNQNNSLKQFLILYYLFKNPNSTIQNLKSQLDLDNDTLNQILNQLTRQKLINLDKHSKLSLTIKGNIYLLKSSTNITKKFFKTFNNLTREEKKMLKSILNKIDTKLKEF